MHFHSHALAEFWDCYLSLPERCSERPTSNSYSSRPIRIILRCSSSQWATIGVYESRAGIALSHGVETATCSGSGSVVTVNMRP